VNRLQVACDEERVPGVVPLAVVGVPVAVVARDYSCLGDDEWRDGHSDQLRLRSCVQRNRLVHSCHCSSVLCPPEIGLAW